MKQEVAMKFLHEKLWNKVLEQFPREEIPCLAAQYEFHKNQSSPLLQGRKILDATPVFFNSCAKFSVLLAAGANLTVAYSDAVPYDREVVELLKSMGITVVKNAYETPEKYDFDLILDCGGFYRSISAYLGVCELTRTGVAKYMDLDRHVFLVDSGKVKAIETCLGTGEACIRALKQFGHDKFSRKKALILGYGKVGRGVAYYFSKEGAEVTVADDLEKIRWNRHETERLNMVSMFDMDALKSAISAADFIISCTGVPGVHKNIASDISTSHAIVANMGLEDEFGEGVASSRVLCHKAPINFTLKEPTRTRFIDPTMALSNAGAYHLTQHFHKNGLIFPPENMENGILSCITNKTNLFPDLELFGEIFNQGEDK